MNKTTAALKLAEEALYAELESDTCEEFAEAAEKCHKALAAIREALADHIANAGKVIADPVKQEPVVLYCGFCNSLPCACPPIPMPTANAAPVSAKCEWVDLTDDEIYPLYNEPTSDREAIDFARAVIAAFKEKNK